MGASGWLITNFGDLHPVGPGEAERIRPVGEPAQVEVVDHLLDEVAHVLDQRHLAVRRRPPCRGRRGPGGRTRASSRSWPRRSRRSPYPAGRDGPPPRAWVRPPGAARARRRRGHPRPRGRRPARRTPLTSRSRTRSRNSPVAMRVKVMTRRRSIGRTPSATYRVVRRGDRERLAGACARLQQRHPGRQLSAYVERPRRRQRSAPALPCGAALVVIGRRSPRARAGRPRAGVRIARTSSTPA